MDKAQIGLIGLGTMGENLARNIANKGFEVAVFNRSNEKTAKFIKNFGGEGKKLRSGKNLQEFVGELSIPRKIILMVKAGEAVDEIIGQLLPLLQTGDIIIDGGNSHYHDTDRRQKELQTKNIHFIGMGISGGEQGALHGPSMMPGGDKEAYKQLEPIFQLAAADDDLGGKCFTYIGPGSSGHFVKMVHNGIEYGLMQVIAESYHLLKSVANLSNDQIAETYNNWNSNGLLKSFLIEISAKIFTRKEDNLDLIDLILDSAGQKGTGKWTTEAALNYGVAIPTINAAVDARIISAGKTFRIQESKKWQLAKIDDEKFTTFTEDVRTALELSMFNTYAQGFQLLSVASQAENWNLNISEICRVWRGGCIIRSAMLPLYQKAFSGKTEAAKTIHNRFSDEAQKQWRKIVALGAKQAIPLPAMSASLSYFDAYRTENLPQNLIQAQRDFFGAHGYERKDKPGTFHGEWENNN